MLYCGGVAEHQVWLPWRWWGCVSKWKCLGSMSCHKKLYRYKPLRTRDFDSKKCQTMKVWCCVYAVMPKPIVTMVTRCFLSHIYLRTLPAVVKRVTMATEWWRPQSSLPKIPCAVVVLLTIWCDYHGNGEALFLYGLCWVYVMSHKAMSLKIQRFWQYW